MDLKRLIHSVANRIGFDVIRAHRSPKRTLLGLADESLQMIIDVGANRGQFARMISRLFPHAEMYCFEPLEQPFSVLSAWASTQGSHVHCFRLALGDEVGRADINLHENHTPSSSFLASTAASDLLYPQTRAQMRVSVRVSTLDRELADRIANMTEGILLKLDVQGFEDRVLRGGRRVLAQCRAVLLEVCLEPLYEDQADFRKIVDFLYDAGFRYAGNLEQVYHTDGRVLFLDAMFVR